MRSGFAGARAISERRIAAARGTIAGGADAVLALGLCVGAVVSDGLVLGSGLVDCGPSVDTGVEVGRAVVGDTVGGRVAEPRGEPQAETTATSAMSRVIDPLMEHRQAIGGRIGGQKSSTTHTRRMALGGTIRGKKTTLRLPTEADLASYNPWMADMRVRRAHSVWHEPAMPETWKERFKEIAKEEMTVLWSIEADGRLIGLAVGNFWSPTEPGFTIRQFLIDPDRWRKGYGSDAALALHRYLFDYLDLKRSGVEIRADNSAALRIAQKLGYAEYARGHDVHYRDGAFVDEVQLFMPRETWHERWASEREYAPLAPGATT